MKSAHFSRHLFSLSLTATFLCAAMPAARAANFTWTGSGGATWNTTDTNWTPSASTPWDATSGPGNYAIFGAAGSATVNGTVYVRAIAYTAGSGTFSLSGDLIGGGVQTDFDVAAGGRLEVANQIASPYPVREMNSGLGTLVLSGNSNVGGGETYLLSGLTVVQSNNALRGAVYVYSGDRFSERSSLELSGGVTVPNLVRIDGRGLDGLGALRVTDGTTNTLSGPFLIFSSGYDTIDSHELRINVNGTGSRLNISGDLYQARSGTVQYLKLEKVGSGTLEVSGNYLNDEGKGTLVSAGSLLVTSAAFNSAVTVATGGTLAGNGTIGAAVSVDAGGTLAPGNGVGILNTGNLALSGGLAVTLDGATAGTQYDQLNVTGGVSLLSGNTLSVSLGFAPALDSLFFLVKNDGSDPIAGLLNGWAQDSTFTLGPQSWKISYTGDSGAGTFTGGNDLVIMAVPEPGTVLLLAGGVAVLLAGRRRSA